MSKTKTRSFSSNLLSMFYFDNNDFYNVCLHENGT